MVTPAGNAVTKSVSLTVYCVSITSPVTLILFPTSKRRVFKTQRADAKTWDTSSVANLDISQSTLTITTATPINIHNDRPPSQHP